MNKALGKPAIIGILIALTLLIVFVGRFAFRDAPGPTLPVADRDMVKQLAIKCGGDFNKLTPEERSKVNTMENGYGAMAVRNIYARSTR